MSRILKAAPLTLALLVGFSGVACAQEEESPFTWNAAVTSDYVFRGVSQTDEGPALQIGADYAFGPGFYVGVWGSNVDFGDDGTDAEIDTYIGWNSDLTESLNLDVAFNRYNYIGTRSEFGDYDYNELISTLATGPFSFTLGYTNDVYASDTDSFYYAAALGLTPGDGDWGVDFGAGYTTFESGVADDYTDYFISVSHPLGPFSAALGYYGTDGSGTDNFGDLADDRIVFTLSFEG